MTRWTLSDKIHSCHKWVGKADGFDLSFGVGGKCMEVWNVALAPLRLINIPGLYVTPYIGCLYPSKHKAERCELCLPPTSLISRLYTD